MKKRTIMMRIGVVSLVMALGLTTGSYGYKIHDMNRPRPPVITPSKEFGQPPSNAIILFDGKDTSQWSSADGGPANWKVENGYMEVARREKKKGAKKKKGDIGTKQAFGSCHLHIEWATPAEVDLEATGQKRGNSGVKLMGRYEVQVLDSYNDINITYADGQAAAIYGQYPPLFNVCRKPGRWQSYDIIFLRPKFDKAGKVARPARMTVLHNGVVVQNNVEIQGSTAHKKKPKYQAHADKLPLKLQDHGSPVRYRNVWIVPLEDKGQTTEDRGQKNLTSEKRGAK